MLCEKSLFLTSTEMGLFIGKTELCLTRQLHLAQLTCQEHDAASPVKSVHVTHVLKKMRKKIYVSHRELRSTQSSAPDAWHSIWHSATCQESCAWHKAVRQAHGPAPGALANLVFATPLPACLECVSNDFPLSFNSENMILRDKI